MLRGLKAKSAAVQEAAFEARCRLSTVMELSDRVVVHAADLYARLKTAGTLISDADILIAATALEHGLVLVTNNVRHFSRIDGLTVESWSTSA